MALLISFMPIFDIGTNGHNFVSPLLVSSTQLNFHFVSIIALTFLTFVELSINVVSLIQFIKSKKTK